MRFTRILWRFHIVSRLSIRGVVHQSQYLKAVLQKVLMFKIQYHEQDIKDHFTSNLIRYHCRSGCLRRKRSNVVTFFPLS